MPALRSVPTLTDGVVTLRAHRSGDAQRCLEQCLDPLSIRWTTVPVPYSLADAVHFVTEAMPGGWDENSEWAFAVEVGGEYAGTVSLRNEGQGRAEIAYGSHPAVRGTGAVHRALELLLAWGFEKLELESVIWWANVGNWASRRAAWRLGFSFAGTVPGWLPHRGELVDGWVGTLRRGDRRAPRTPWLECPVLEGDGVRLRPIVEDDAERIAEACADERTQSWLGQLPAPYTLQDAQTYVAGRTAMQAEARGVTWAVTAPEDDAILAMVSYFDLTPGLDCEVGYWTHPEARGRGLMTRAVAQVLGHLFTDLQLVRATGVVAVDNTASRRVLEANGMRLCGVERSALPVRNARSDAAVYDVLATEWREARG